MDNNYYNDKTNYLMDSVEKGRWVPVDENSLGFSLPPLPTNRPVAGPDGAIYCMGEASAELRSVASNANTSIPTPSSIVQMPAIVQPIALVPFTSQNQPMLQYDPYYRPEEPVVSPKSPVYVKKAYRPVSATALIITLVVLAVMLFLSVAVFQANGLRLEEFKLNGINSIMAIGDLFGLSDSDAAYNLNIIKNQDTMSKISTIVVFAFPIIIALASILFLALFLKYLYKFFKKDSPRGFSVAALANIILLLLAFVGLFIMFNAEAQVDSLSENITTFLIPGEVKATIAWGYGLLAALVGSIILFFLPFFAKKNAYIVEKDDPMRKTYIIED